MKAETCDREAAILAALRAGRLGDDDLAHVRSCPDCSLAVDAERWMGEAAAALTPARLPSPGSLLLRAQLRARREAAERSLRPIGVWRRLALAAGAATLTGLAIGGSFFRAGWSAAPSPELALLAAGVLALAALPVWLRARRDPV